MFALLCCVLAVLVSPFKSKIRLEAENAALRHQFIVLRYKVQGRVLLTNNDRRCYIQLYRWVSSIPRVLTIIGPETVCIGIGPAFATNGVGNRARGEGGLRLRRICAR
jgi:hypothetical protein